MVFTFAIVKGQRYPSLQDNMEKGQNTGNNLVTIGTQAYVGDVDLERTVFRHTGFGEDGDDDKGPSLVPVIPAR